MMPWGYTAPGDPTSLRANYGSTGTAPVDAYPFGISPFGAYNLAGNVKEWTANPLADGHGVIGGSWADPLYVYSAYGALAPTASAATLPAAARVDGASNTARTCCGGAEDEPVAPTGAAAGAAGGEFAIFRNASSRANASCDRALDSDESSGSPAFALSISSRDFESESVGRAGAFASTA